MRRTPINLTVDGTYTEWISTFGKFMMAADIQVASGITWSTAVVGMQWSMTSDAYARGVTFSPAVIFTATTPGVVNINIASMVWVRFIVTTAEGANDPNAVISYMCE